MPERIKTLSDLIEQLNTSWDKGCDASFGPHPWRHASYIESCMHCVEGSRTIIMSGRTMKEP